MQTIQTTQFKLLIEISNISLIGLKYAASLNRFKPFSQIQITGS